MQLALPGDADISAMQPLDFKKEFKGSGAQPAYQFSDGQSAPFVKLQYGGNLFVTHALEVSEQVKFRNIAHAWMNDLSETIKKNHGKGASGKLLQFENLAPQNSTMVGWRVNRSHIAYAEVGKNSVLWKAKGELEDVPTLSRDYLHIVKMDNRIGLSSFVKIKRTDKSEDYGFFAVVRGQPNAQGDRPDLRLYVIRDTTQARHKPASVLDEKGFLAMAENIAASVRARSVR